MTVPTWSKLWTSLPPPPPRPSFNSTSSWTIDSPALWVHTSGKFLSCLLDELIEMIWPTLLGKRKKHFDEINDNNVGTTESWAPILSEIARHRAGVGQPTEDIIVLGSRAGRGQGRGHRARMVQPPIHGRRAGWGVREAVRMILSISARGGICAIWGVREEKTEGKRTRDISYEGRRGE